MLLPGNWRLRINLLIRCTVAAIKSSLGLCCSYWAVLVIVWMQWSGGESFSNINLECGQFSSYIHFSPPVLTLITIGQLVGHRQLASSQQISIFSVGKKDFTLLEEDF